MKKHILQIACALSLALISVTGTMAQDTTSRGGAIIAPPLFTGNSGFKTWSIGVHGGAMFPISALGGRNDFSKWNATLGYGAYIKYQTSHVFGLQLDFLKGTLKGDNSKLWVGLPPPGPFASFQTELHYAASLSGVVTLGNINWSQLHTSIQPYLSLGGGIASYNATTVSNSGVSVSYNPNGNNSAFYVPFGLGLKANLSQSINLDLGYTMAYVDADDLDGYEKSPFNGDKFSYAHIGLEFMLGRTNKPQLSRHNPPAQLYRNMKDGDDAMAASLRASEERYNQRLAEINALRDDLNKMKMDSDGDGVSDYFDKCPNTPRGTKVDGSGCALPMPVPMVVRDTIINTHTTYVITEEDKRIVSEAVHNLEFEFGKATIRERSLPYLNRVATMLQQKGFSLKLAGHTDWVGSDAANMRLSKDRAESVKNYLSSQGASSSRIEATGYGETQPIATNKTEAGRQKNRRVEFTLY